VTGKEKTGKSGKGGAARQKRSLFNEIMSGVEAIGEHRTGRLSLRTYKVSPITVPPLDPQLVRETREGLRRGGASPTSRRPP
jgi:hypothetical protein